MAENKQRQKFDEGNNQLQDNGQPKNKMAFLLQRMLKCLLHHYSGDFPWNSFFNFVPASLEEQEKNSARHANGSFRMFHFLDVLEQKHNKPQLKWTEIIISNDENIKIKYKIVPISGEATNTALARSTKKKHAEHSE